MIRIDDNGSMLNGSVIDIALDLARGIELFRKLVSEEYDEELADNLLVNIGRIRTLDCYDEQVLKEHAAEIGGALLAYERRKKG